ncbi:uncharacterized protein OCT59_007606 [Rhizophagus irregularis]|uniref:Uncharacterized protein n=4 Tax=Rhizophagus irregularis TaxID=588596 RepID=A0A915YS92_9GLOM|nr:hypothetical protein OCT59_007606 [Rhizophagus irregularis]GBC33438.2 hypothetical protein GLOIN_2v1582196 [Rhizophagus irregularis DAOM 181602=DAOM 197198]CAB4478341.1 unnamed protein product [Rhizophagus irregularis]CAB5185211.1 unnamed protein product [Rhizophagus irregularis]CAB5322282.1 unnamed protein product [Rhizophagus irregularis]
MFIRKLCIILILSAIVKISISYRQYPQHKVNYKYRGYLKDMIDSCVNFIDWQQNVAYRQCYNYTESRMLSGEETSPFWSVGYQLCTKVKNFPHDRVLCTDSFFWWDDFVGKKFCDDMHLHIKGFDYKLSWTRNNINENENCVYLN